MARNLILSFLYLLLLAGPAGASEVVFADPTGDDFGAGKLTYPTDPVYTRGSFDLKKLTVQKSGSKIVLRIRLAQRIDDPWDSRSWPEKGNGFSIQMVQVYFDLDPAPGAGHRKTLPGINARFAENDRWERVVVVSPQAAARIRREVRSKAPALAQGVVIPKRVKVRGSELIATLKAKDLPGLDLSRVKLQVVVQSNEGFPAAHHLLSRRVNEYAGQHRFGGGNDFDCDPHAIDILAGKASGEEGEKAAQKAALAYTCGDEGKSVKEATLPMVTRP